LSDRDNRLEVEIFAYYFLLEYFPSYMTYHVLDVNIASVGKQHSILVLILIPKDVYEQMAVSGKISFFEV
jgi:hypothetical protein